jgi:hypothetical protein
VGRTASHTRGVFLIEGEVQVFEIVAPPQQRLCRAQPVM